MRKFKIKVNPGTFSLFQMDNTKLKKLSKDQHTSVKKTVKEITVAVEKCHFQNLQLGTALFLNSQLQQYFERYYLYSLARQEFLGIELY